MFQFLLFIFLSFFSFNSFGNANQILPNGSYEFIWKVYYPDKGKIDIVANDYAEINNDQLSFSHMPCHKGLDANLRNDLKYEFNKDLSQFTVSGNIALWADRWIKDENNKWLNKDIKISLSKNNIENDDPDFYEIKASTDYLFGEKLSLTISKKPNKHESSYKCLYEKIDFKSSTPLTANEMINGLEHVKEKDIDVFGKLFFPVGLNNKVPLVITIHPSMGFVPHDYFEWFNNLGVAVFDIQPYLSRGIESQWFYEVSEEAATVDAYKALDIMSKDPRIDKDKIILVGWSYGAMVVNNAHQQFFIDKIKPKNEFQAFISYYPFCSLMKEDTKTSEKPLTILIGEKDRMCPFELCQDYMGIVKKSSPNSNIHIFEKSYHRFDFNLLPKAVNIGRAEKWDEEYLEEVISSGKRYDIGEEHEDIMGPNGWSYVSLLSDSEKDKLLDPHREDANYIGYNKKADKEARDIMANIISNL